MRHCAILLGIVVCASIARAAPDPAAIAKITETIKNDSSFKVRMQAIRVLMKQLDKKSAPSDAVLDALAHAATKDDEHLVRGLACYALGQLGDPRGKPTLDLALKDEDAFVRAQAEEAQKAIAKNTSPPPADAGA